MTVSFPEATERIDFLSVDDLSFEVIIGLATLRKLHTHINLENDVVQINIGDKKGTLEVYYDHLSLTEVTICKACKEFTIEFHSGNISRSSEDDVFDVIAAQNQEKKIDSKAYFEITDFKCPPLAY